MGRQTVLRRMKKGEEKRKRNFEKEDQWSLKVLVFLMALFTIAPQAMKMIDARCRLITRFSFYL